MLTGLPKKLVTDGLLEKEVAVAAVQQASKSKIPFVTYITQEKLVPSLPVALAASVEFGAPMLDLSVIDQSSLPISLVTEKLIREHSAMPLMKRGNQLFVALSDPTNLNALDEIKFHSGLKTEAIVVEEDKLKECIDAVLQARESASVGASLEDATLDDLDFSSGEEEEKDDSSVDVDDAPIVRFVHKILLDAINSGASDVHFEPYENEYRIRFRQDGILRIIAQPPVNLASRLSSRIKIMSRLDISERRVPQDGRFKLKLSKNRSIDFRVSTCPTLYGEKAVLRILDSSAAKLNIDKLGYSSIQKDLFLKNIHHPQGMVLVTGPTGSGKTVSLYTALNILNTPEINISTAEDPVEINLPGINQVNMNVKAGLTFATSLRSFLRQDPDIVMVGEIRDLETAEIAVKAAQTGHMVLSTLHTNSAPETLTRLMNMGVPTFNIATSINLIIAQRLARCLCEKCKKEAEIPKKALKEQGFSDEQIETTEIFYGAVGCDQCNDGYKGRCGIYEVMPISGAISRIIMENGNAIDIADQAMKEGINNLRLSGLEKVVEGKTSIEEINRITKDW